MQQPRVIKESELIVLPKEKNLTISVEEVKTPARKYLTPEIIREHLDAMPAGSARMLCSFLWKTGVRISEAITITKRDIDCKNMIIRIRWLKSRKYVERNIPMHPTIKDQLAFYIAPMNLEDRLFPITRQRAHQITTKWFRRSPHVFRHSFAVNWIRCGGDLVILSRYLGHARVQETMEYLKIVPIDQSKELLKIRFD
jgi:integrase